ncbi:hypothetical protein LCGC14_0540200 [marine sediment metagenome]|uniref:Ribbon-helix-helix protein CopG domain-containing protein n=1 Tax=marine sediment metagenome TaxID=412755 RepID=A0A0F9V186_9ZZZZ
MTVVKTLSMTNKTLKRLVDMSEKIEINASLLFRMMINYFHKNKDKIKELVEGDYNND